MRLWQFPYVFPVLNKCVSPNGFTQSGMYRDECSGLVKRLSSLIYGLFYKMILNKFYQITSRKKCYSGIDELQKDLDGWVECPKNERPDQGKMYCGRS